ncbi:LLM class flavin-dependent oxidoreductase [Mycobacterium intracellulare]|uniref:LLM class flavin-dependent oxidoreductase n=1 Tax=Mycobacterium intracellulare TaxID=1767 RepID=UPI001E4346DC
MLRDEGFTRVWMSQLPYEPDLLTILAIALHEVDTIEVASGVVPIQNLHPMLMAQRALTLSLASGGRFTLGLGMTHQAVTEGMWGIPWDKPVRRLNEYLDGLLPLLAGEPAAAAGETVTTRGALMITGAPKPDVYIAALGPQLLKIAGRRTSGTCTWMTGPKTLAEHVGPTLRGRRRCRPGERGACRRVVARQRHRRCRRRPQAGGRTVRHLRRVAVIPCDARPRGLRGAAGCRHHRRRGHRARPARRAARRRRRRVCCGGIRSVTGGPGPHAGAAARLRLLTRHLAMAIHCLRNVWCRDELTRQEKRSGRTVGGKGRPHQWRRPGDGRIARAVAGRRGSQGGVR